MKYLIDSTTLTGIADSIRAKTGETGTIKVNELYSKVDSIPTGETINNQDKTITENGTYTADEGYTGLGTVVVDVPSSEPTLQDKSIEITENGTTEVTADEGYNGINSVEITTNVSGGESNPYQGTFDVEGLKYLGYDDDTIEWYNAFCPWIKEYDDEFKLTDEDKAMKGEITTDNISNYKYSLVYLPYIDTSNITSMASEFASFSLLMTIPLIDTSNATNTSNMFEDCTSLTAIPLINTSKSKKMNYMFDNCVSLKMIPPIDTSNATDMSNMFQSCYSLKKILPIDTSNVTKMSYMFSYCKALTKIPSIDTSNVTNMNCMFQSSVALTTIPLINMSKVVNVAYLIRDCASLTTLGGFKNLGQAYSTTAGASYSNYTLDLSYSTVLTHDSLMNIINNLYDIATKGCNTQKVTLGSTNLAKLTAEEIEIATNKGFSVS